MFNKLLEDFEKSVPSAKFEKVELDESLSDAAKIISSAINHRLGGSHGLGEAIELAFRFVAKRKIDMPVEKLKSLYWDEVMEHLRRTMNKQYNELAALSSTDNHYTDSEMAIHLNKHYDPIRIVHEEEIQIPGGGSYELDQAYVKADRILSSLPKALTTENFNHVINEVATLNAYLTALERHNKEQT